MMRNLTTAAEGKNYEMKDKKKLKIKQDEWNPYRSKWKAAIEKGLNILPKKEDNILYLGASSGTTINHISKLTSGIIFAIENSPKMAISLVKLATQKNNIAPIFSDAREIEFIEKSLFNKRIDILFQDIPSIDQVQILGKASNLVDKNCKILLSLKTQSISQKSPKQTALEVKEQLRKYFKIYKIINS